MGKLRSIRLKEFDPNRDIWHTPTPKYRAGCNETLEDGPFHELTDENGFLVSGNPGPQGEQVVFLGGSFVQSMFADTTVRFISQVERLTGFTCLNGGYSGSTTLQLFNVMVNKVYPIIGIGGRVVFFVGQSDGDYMGSAATYWNNHPRGTTLIPGKAPTAGRLPESYDATRRVTQIVVDAARALDIDLTLAVSAYALPDFNNDRTIRAIYKRDRVAYMTMLGHRDGIADAARKVAADNGVPLIDGHAHLGGDPSLFYDELHLNRAGHTRFAEFVAREVTQSR